MCLSRMRHTHAHTDIPRLFPFLRAVNGEKKVKWTTQAATERDGE